MIKMHSMLEVQQLQMFFIFPSKPTYFMKPSTVLFFTLRFLSLFTDINRETDIL